MDFAQTNGLSMIGNDDFVTEEQLNGYVTLDTAQTITGDKTLSGTTTFDGAVVSNDNFDNNGTLNNNNILENHTIINNLSGAVIDNQSGAEIRLSAGSKITANSFDISPIELGYLNNASSNLQTQLNGKVGISNDEDITGAKTFTQEVFAGRRAVNQAIRLANAPLGVGYAFIDYRSGGLSGDYDVRMFSEGGSSTVGEVGRGDFTIKSGTNTFDTFTSNTLKINGTPKITMTTSDNTLSNTNNILTTSAVGGSNQLVATGASSYTDIRASTNYFDATSSTLLRIGPRLSEVPKITITSSLTTLSNTSHTINGVTTFDVPPVSATAPTSDSQVANKKYVDDTVVAGAFVTLAGTQTITGNKTFSGTTTFTGDITANAVNITPTELGYIGGLTSDAQTQITARALDSNVVHKSGNETVNGEKVFTGTTVVAYTNANTNIQFANVPNYTFIDMCSGGSADTDVRLSSTGGSGGAFGGGFSAEARYNYLAAYGSGSAGYNKLETTGGSGSYNQLTSHQNYIDATADNILRIGGTNRLSMNANTTTLTNQYNTLNATITNLLSATTTGSQNYLFTSGTNSNNLLEATGTGSYNYLNAPSNTINASSGGTNYIRVSGIDKLVIRSDATTAADQMIAPIYKIGTYASSVPLLSFQLHGVKRGANTTAGILLGPCYNFTSTDEMFNYCLPCNIEFTRATLMFDADGTSSGTMNLDFSRKSTNGGTPALVHSMGVAYTTGGATSFSQAFPINTGSPLKYNAGEFITVAYSGSPANEWGIVFHGFQY
jgi:hypothetical protein